MFGHRVRGPLAVVKEVWSESCQSEPLLDFVCRTRERLHQALELAREHLLGAQSRMKAHYDQKACVRRFNPGDEVL